MVKKEEENTGSGKKGKDKPNEPKYVMICPRCNSTDVSANFSNPAQVATGLFNNFHKCHHCGHVSMVFPEVPENQVPKIPKDPDKVKNRTLVDTTYGRGAAGMWKLFGPLALLYSFFFLTSSEFIIQLFALTYSLPVSIFVTFFAYKRDYLVQSRALRFISGIFILSIIFVPFFWVIFFYGSV